MLATNFNDEYEYAPCFIGPNPLDFLIESGGIKELKRSPRSSIESSDRQLEIPACQPPYISRHLRPSSDRATTSNEQSSENFRSPQPLANRNPLFKLGSFMDSDTFEDGRDCLLFNDRERLNSLTSSCCFFGSTINLGATSAGTTSTSTTSSTMLVDSSANSHLLSQKIIEVEITTEVTSKEDANVVVDDIEVEDNNNDEKCMMETSSLLNESQEEVSSSKETRENSIDNIRLLKPIPSTSNTTTTIAPQNAVIKVSREGLRQQHSRRPVQSKTARMMNRKANRRKKTSEQLDYLKDLFHQSNGVWNGKMKEQAMQQTGLSRVQIYKWMFDMKQLQERPKKFIAPEERISYSPAILEPTSKQELERGTASIKPIFLVERVQRA